MESLALATPLDHLTGISKFSKLDFVMKGGEVIEPSDSPL
jgi:hypothetical protein